MKKAIIIVVILAVGGGLIYYAATQNKAQAPTAENTDTKSQQEEDQQPVAAQPQSSSTAATGLDVSLNSETKPPVGGQFSNGENEVTAPDIQVVEISYDGSKFTPSTVNIKLNDYVIFRNNSTRAFWPASAPHPSHTAYPEFDAKKEIAAGGKYQFQFTKEGSWGFHDHLNATVFGKINVTK